MKKKPPLPLLAPEVPKRKTKSALFPKRRPVPEAVKSAADIWIDCFLDYAKSLIEAKAENTTFINSKVIMDDARELADAALNTIQDRWPDVDL